MSVMFEFIHDDGHGHAQFEVVSLVGKELDPLDIRALLASYLEAHTKDYQATWADLALIWGDMRASNDLRRWLQLREVELREVCTDFLIFWDEKVSPLTVGRPHDIIEPMEA